jgi:hypothetical protein
MILLSPDRFIGLFANGALPCNHVLKLLFRILSGNAQVIGDKIQVDELGKGRKYFPVAQIFRYFASC